MRDNAHDAYGEERMIKHSVQQGDCVSSIAEQYGFYWETIWNDPGNAQLKQLRRDPNVLLPGDVLVVPDRRLREESRPTDAKHSFVRKGVPAKVKLRLVNLHQEPRPGLAYIADIDGEVRSGASDSDGYIEFTVKPSARKILLTIDDNGRQEKYQVPLGHLDPIKEAAGVRKRLANIGFVCGPESGSLIDGTREALRAFQTQMDLPATGEADDATCAKLQEVHGS
jgi:hypothetical protein